jgi:hypothetical protein
MDCPTNGIEEEKRDFSIYETPVKETATKQCPSAPNPERTLSRSEGCGFVSAKKLNDFSIYETPVKETVMKQCPSAPNPERTLSRSEGCEFVSAKKLYLECEPRLSRSTDFENDSASDSDNLGEALEAIAKLAEHIQPDNIKLPDNFTLQENASVLETHLAIVNLGEEQLETLRRSGEKPRLILQDDAAENVRTETQYLDDNASCENVRTETLGNSKNPQGVLNGASEEGEIVEPVNFPATRKWKADRMVPGSLRRPRSKSPGERASRQLELLMKEAYVFNSYP